MSFLFPTLLTIGLPLIAVPMLIHLINCGGSSGFAGRRCSSCSRASAATGAGSCSSSCCCWRRGWRSIAVLVLMLAHLVLRNEWLQPAGPRHDASSGAARRQLLDERSLGRHLARSAKASGPCRRSSTRPHQQSDTQLVTLLRFSEAARLSAGAQPKVFSRADQRHLSQPAGIAAGRLGDVANRRRPGRRAQGRSRGCRWPTSEQTLILYLVSDFRARQFAQRHRGSQAAGRPGGKRTGRADSSRCAASTRRGRTWRSRRSSRNRACGRRASKCG